MKKTNYLGKYDYINYYTRQPSLWFFNHAEIQSMLKLNALDVDNDDDEDENEYSSDDDGNLDPLEYYKKMRDEQAELDHDDPKIIEGNLLDIKSRQHIISLYPGFKVVDFESKIYKHIKQEEIAKLTEQTLLENENVICFQAVFIANNLITKPDAIVKEGLAIKLYETKSTTTAKLVHYLDIFFQSKVLNQQMYLNDFYFEYNLCLTAYCYAQKYEVPFITTSCINLKKSLNLTNTSFEFKQSLKLGLGYVLKGEFCDEPIDLLNLCNGDYSDLDTYIEASTGLRQKSLIKHRTLLEDSYQNFDIVIETLTKHLSNMRIQDIENKTRINKYIHIKPHPNEKSMWKVSDLFADLRVLFYKKGYEIFKYSGNIVDQSAQTMINLSNNKNFEIPFKKNMAEIFLPALPLVLINKSACQTLFFKLKQKCVYFDFETINTPFRPIDHCLPYMQIITQCSIIKKHHEVTAYDKLTCNNILFDPKNITINNFKQLVDDLYEGSDYSYVVYNISFERSRLKELITYIDEPEYTQKIKIIIDNLYDLADFFDLRKSPSAIIIKSLGGFYSIKKVLHYIENDAAQIFKLTGCHDYKKLAISNGLICQNATMKRFHNTLDDDQWNALCKDLRTYCENDVRAMIAVELLAKQMMNEI